MFRLSVTVLIGVTLAACADGVPQDRTEDAATAGGMSEVRPPSSLQLTDAQQSGRRLFETVCWTCHGSAGRGDGPVVLVGSVPAPPNFLAGEYPKMSAADLERRFRGVLAGTDETHPHMQYITSVLEPEKFLEALDYVPVLSYPSEIPGSAIAGSVMYRVRCRGCHGEFGRGDGAAAEFLVLAKPADFTQDTLIARRDWDAVFQRIREGGEATHSSMPPWGILFSEDEMWDLVAFVSSLQPGILPSLAVDVAR